MGNSRASAHGPGRVSVADRKFIEPGAEIVLPPDAEILPYAERTGAISFDAKGARYTHRDGLCSFEVLVEEYGLGTDPALALMARDDELHAQRVIPQWRW
jgi:hypothetical protein